MTIIRPACADDPHRCILPDFIVGQDRSGRWIVRDEQGLIGGVFRDREAAERFAAFESGHRAGAVRHVPQGVRIELTGPLPRALARNVFVLPAPHPAARPFADAGARARAAG